MDSRTSFVVLFSIIFNVQVMLHMQKQNWAESSFILRFSKLNE